MKRPPDKPLIRPLALRATKQILVRAAYWSKEEAWVEPRRIAVCAAHLAVSRQNTTA